MRSRSFGAAIASRGSLGVVAVSRIPQRVEVEHFGWGKSVSAYFRSEQWRTQMNDSGHSIEHNRRPCRLALLTQRFDSSPHPLRERDQIDSSIVLIRRHERDALLNT